MVEPQSSKLITRVRFPSSPPLRLLASWGHRLNTSTSTSARSPRADFRLVHDVACCQDVVVLASPTNYGRLQVVRAIGVQSPFVLSNGSRFCATAGASRHRCVPFRLSTSFQRAR